MVHVVIPDEKAEILHSDQSGTGPFSFTFVYFQKADIEVYVNDDLLDASDWSVTPSATLTGGFSGGNITLNDAVTNAEVLIVRKTRAGRTTDFGVGGAKPQGVDSAFDLSHAILVDIYTRLDRTLQFRPGENNQAPFFPPPDDRKNKLFKFSADGLSLVFIEANAVETLAGLTGEIAGLAGLAEELTLLGTAAIVDKIDTLGDSALVIKLEALGEAARLAAMDAIYADFNLGAGSFILNTPANASAAAASASTASSAASAATNAATAAEDSATEAADDAVGADAAALLSGAAAIDAVNRLPGGPYASVAAVKAAVPGVVNGAIYQKTSDGLLWQITDVTTEAESLWPTKVVVGPASSTAARVAGFADTSGQVLNDTGVSVAALLTAPNIQAATTLTISGGSVTATRAIHVIAAESGTADDLDSVDMSAFVVGGECAISADSDDTITITTGVGNITTDTGASIVLDAVTKYATLTKTASGVVASLGGGGASATVSVADKTALAALTLASTAQVVTVTVADQYYGGTFRRVTSDISTEVAADTTGAIYVPFFGGDGTTGGFVRNYEGAVNPGWFGATFGQDVSSGVADANADAMEAAIVFQSALGGGAIAWRGVLEISDAATTQGTVAAELRTGVELVGLRDESGFAQRKFLGLDKTGMVLRLATGSNVSLLGVRSGAKWFGARDMVLDGNALGNPAPGNHCIKFMAYDGGNGTDAAIVKGVFTFNCTGYGLYAYDIDPASFIGNAFASGVFIGAGSDTLLSLNQIDGSKIKGAAFDGSSGSAINTSTETFTVAGHELYDGLKVYYDDGGGTAPTGITDGNDYYIINATATTFQISATYGGSAVNITALGVGASHVIWPYANHPALFVDGSSGNHILDNITFGPAVQQRSATFTASGTSMTVSDYQGFLYDGAPVMVETTTTLPTGLDEHNVYYARQSSGTTWNLYTAPVGGSAASASDAGTGTHRIRSGKLGEVFLFSGSLKGKQGLVVAGNRFAGAYGSAVTLINMGYAVRWAATNDIYEYNQSGTTTLPGIGQLGDSVTTENIGFPYSFTFVYTNSGAGTGADATIVSNQAAIINYVRKQASGAWRPTFTKTFSASTDFIPQAETRKSIRHEIGTKFTTSFDLWTHTAGTLATFDSSGVNVTITVYHNFGWY